MSRSLVGLLRMATSISVLTASLLLPGSAFAAQAVGTVPGNTGCPKRPAPVICVDLSHQRLWVQKNGKTGFPSVPIRSGRRGDATRTGWFHVFRRDEHHWSNEYSSPMPYSLFFSGGQAIHGVAEDLSRGPGSHGCVNIGVADARRLWAATTLGEAVYVWGRKPGT
ncbi:L,D-transpeptidase [Catenulispora pinisilvae]|uniref:L,D-transpeptidase n=1 Tax=Catenulispora pinisilvae TaxID=2705253 RepID=UPI0018918B0C|nr:L,D-transpeptidase [Catenulispora pinisilvae]